MRNDSMESKRTKNWSDGWLAKLRDDQRAAKAEMALIISHVLPKGVESFNFIEGVWVAEPRCAIPALWTSGASACIPALRATVGIWPSMAGRKCARP